MIAIQSIVHPTDFSEASAGAFAHALKIALAAKATLTVLHVAGAHDMNEWEHFPHVRRTLADWGLMDADEPPEAIARKLGMTVRKVEMVPQAPLEGIVHYLRTHAGRPDRARDRRPRGRRALAARLGGRGAGAPQPRRRPCSCRPRCAASSTSGAARCGCATC